MTSTKCRRSVLFRKSKTGSIPGCFSSPATSIPAPGNFSSCTAPRLWLVGHVCTFVSPIATSFTLLSQRKSSQILSLEKKRWQTAMSPSIVPASICCATWFCVPTLRPGHSLPYQTGTSPPFLGGIGQRLGGTLSPYISHVLVPKVASPGCSGACAFPQTVLFCASP